MSSLAHKDGHACEATGAEFGFCHQETKKYGRYKMVTRAPFENNPQPSELPFVFQRRDQREKYSSLSLKISGYRVPSNSCMNGKEEGMWTLLISLSTIKLLIDQLICLSLLTLVYALYTYLFFETYTL